MKKLKLLAVAIVCISFLGWEASAQSTQPENVIGIDKSYSANIPSSLQARLDSTIVATAKLFNSGMHTFKVEVNDSSAEQSIMLHITKGKLATKKQRNVAYLVNLIVPVYIPMHKIKSSITFPEGFSSDNNVKQLKSSAHILVGNISKREDKLLQKYADKLLQQLNYLDKHMSPGFESSIK